MFDYLKYIESIDSYLRSTAKIHGIKVPLSTREIISNAGLITSGQIIGEYKLIQEKQSKLSRKERDAVVSFVNSFKEK